MIITNRVTIKRSDNSENNMDNMHTQSAKRDMALEKNCKSLGAYLLLVHPRGGRCCSGKRWLLVP